MDDNVIEEKGGWFPYKFSFCTEVFLTKPSLKTLTLLLRPHPLWDSRWFFGNRGNLEHWVNVPNHPFDLQFLAKQGRCFFPKNLVLSR